MDDGGEVDFTSFFSKGKKSAGASGGCVDAGGKPAPRLRKVHNDAGGKPGRSDNGAHHPGQAGTPGVPVKAAGNTSSRAAGTKARAEPVAVKHAGTGPGWSATAPFGSGGGRPGAASSGRAPQAASHAAEGDRAAHVAGRGGQKQQHQQQQHQRPGNGSDVDGRPTKKQRLGPTPSSSSGSAWGFEVDYNDHFETSLQAVADLAPVLHRLSAKPAELRVYDPYFCRGGIRKHYQALGFDSLIHENRDFYADVAAGRVPQHDILVTNPPYSGARAHRDG